MKILFLFLLFTFSGVALNLLPIQKSVLPYLGNVDAGIYIELSHNIENSYINDLDFFGFVLGGLNWFSLPYLLYLINIEEGWWRMAIINGFVFLMIIQQLWVLGRQLKLSPSVYTVACLVCMPHLWCWLFIPSKENFTVLGFLILFNWFRGYNRSSVLILVAALCGILKSQILVSAVIKKTLDFFGRYYFIVTLLAINFFTILVNYFYPEALSVELYLNNAPEEINSAPLIIIIDKIVQLPVIGIAGLILRLLLYVMGGISAIKSFFTSFETFLMTFPSFMVGLLSLFFGVIIPKANKLELQFFWSLMAVFLFIPFIQFRYFWWTIPFLLYFIFQKRTLSPNKTSQLPILINYPT